MTPDPDLLFVITSHGLGDGEPDLGEKLMNSFLKVLGDSERLPAKMLFLNSGIFLTTEGSPHLEILMRFAETGVEIASCGTCLDYFGRREKLAVGAVGDMKDTVESMLSFKVVRTL